jgi:acyl carrier protein
MPVTHEEVESKVCQLIAEQLGTRDFTMDSEIVADLDADSLDVIELTIALEENFGIQISDEEAEKLTTVGDVIEYIEKRVQG